MTPYQCPVCQVSLAQSGKQLACDHGHTFDLARQGYINLLLSHKKKSRHPGDDKQMVLARKAFLDSGAYQTFLDAVIDQVQSAIAEESTVSVLDAGCGDGYYTTKFYQALVEQHPGSEVSVWGVDISKEAMITACKRTRYLNMRQIVSWCVASAVSLPFLPGSQNVVTCLFARVSAEEFRRVLKQNGTLIVAGAAPDHLFELRELIYPDVRQKSFSVESDLSPRFDRIAQRRVQFSFVPDTMELLDALLAMTPHGWRISPERKAAARGLLGRPVRADIVVESWRAVKKIP